MKTYDGQVITLEIATKQILEGAQGGWYMACDPWGRPLLARPTQDQAMRDGQDFLRRNPSPEMKVCGVVVKGVNEPRCAT